MIEETLQEENKPGIPTFIALIILVVFLIIMRIIFN